MEGVSRFRVNAYEEYRGPAIAFRLIPDKIPTLAELNVDEIVSTLSNLECDEFIENKNKDDYKSPLYTLTLKGINTYSISLFEKKDNKHPAVSSQSDYPFLLSEWKAKRIMKDLSSFTEEE